MGCEDRTYLCIDLKSFYASVECADRGLDPFTTNLVVADPDRSKNTICLAITPAMKAQGVKNRCRMRDIPAGMEYLTAVPRMRRYMDVSAQIYRIYLRFVSSEDVHVYSIDECFIDATPYLRLYNIDARTLALRMTAAVREETGITATCGIGTNLFLAKVALDVTAKHAVDGIGMLDERSFKREIWFHQPITDIWGIGHGIARRLAKRGVYDLAGICATNPDVLRREFGKNAEHLIDHAWGLEPCTIAQIRAYTPKGHSLSNGQVLMRDYSATEARTVLREMIYGSAMDLAEKHLACGSVGLYVGYSASMVPHQHWEWAAMGARGFGPAGAPRLYAGGQRKLGRTTASERILAEALLELFDETIDPNAKIRRINVALGDVVPVENATHTLFDNVAAEEKEQNLAEAMVAVKSRFGANAVLRGTSLKNEANMRERNQQIGGHRA
jgi:DNA polymerase V